MKRGAWSEKREAITSGWHYSLLTSHYSLFLNPYQSLKSLILISLFTFLFSLSVSAQVGERRTDLSVGGNAGFLLSRIDFTPSIKQNWKPAPTFGFTARYICEKYFTAICGVQLEVNYANMGWK